jgi:osmotically-inducible protein OsmY
LNGTVSAGLQREYAESVANQAPGVAKVINSINVSH